MPALLTLRHDLEDFRSEVHELLFADPVNLGQLRERLRSQSRDFAQRAIAENDVGGNTARGGELAPELAQRFEQRRIDAFPRFALALRFSPPLLARDLHQPDGRVAA